VKRRPPTVRLPMCSSMSSNHLKSEMVGRSQILIRDQTDEVNR